MQFSVIILARSLQQKNARWQASMCMSHKLYRGPGEKQEDPQLSLGVLNGQREQTRKMERGRGWGGGDRRPGVVNSAEREAEETG